MNIRSLYRISFIFFVLCAIYPMCAASLSHASWLIFSKPAYEGKIFDAETGEPIKGAVVVAIYDKSTIGLVAGGYSTAFHVVEALTDKNGWFRIPSYLTLINPLSYGEPTTFIIFKPGYAAVSNQDLEDVFTNRFKGVAEYPWQLQEKRKFQWSSGVVRLPNLKTSEERRKNTIFIPSEIMPEQLPLLNKAIEEDRGIK